LTKDEFIKAFREAAKAGYTGFRWSDKKGKGCPVSGMLVLAGKWTPELQAKLAQASMTSYEPRPSQIIAQLFDVPAERVRVAYLTWMKTARVKAVVRALKKGSVLMAGITRLETVMAIAVILEYIAIGLYIVSLLLRG
jgi:hypothetical protein